MNIQHFATFSQIKSKQLIEIILYIIIGFCTTGVNFIVYYLLKHIVQLNLYTSVGIAWLIAALFAFVCNRIIVFRHKKSFLKSLILFKVARIFSLLLELGIMFVGVELLYINDIYVKLFSMFFILVSNYIFSKMVVFK